MKVESPNYFNIVSMSKGRKGSKLFAEVQKEPSQYSEYVSHTKQEKKNIVHGVRNCTFEYLMSGDTGHNNNTNPGCSRCGSLVVVST